MTNISDATKRHSEKGGNHAALDGKEDTNFSEMSTRETVYRKQTRDVLPRNRMVAWEVRF
jgi:hypothetical protein